MDASESDLADLLEQAALRWQPTAARRWEVHTEECEALSDVSLLESALDALIENAIRHTCDGDGIYLRCSRRGGEVVIQVSDDGNGIPEQLLPRLFERRVEPTPSVLDLCDSQQQDGVLHRGQGVVILRDRQKRAERATQDLRPGVERQ